VIVVVVVMLTEVLVRLLEEVKEDVIEVLRVKEVLVVLEVEVVVRNDVVRLVVVVVHW